MYVCTKCSEICYTKAGAIWHPDGWNKQTERGGGGGKEGRALGALPIRRGGSAQADADAAAAPAFWVREKRKAAES